jgi:hypothetical protein
MKHILLITLLAAPAFADGGITVRLPDDARIAEAAKPEFLAELVVANVIGMNCPGFEIDQGEWTLITGTADKVAAALKIETTAYDDQFYGPAFAMLDKPGSCEAEGPKIAPLIEKLKAMGGDTKPIG